MLAHTIYQTLSFDAAMLEEGFDVEGTSFSNGSDEWDGISEVILGNPDWFETWLSAEKQCKLFAHLINLSLLSNI